MYQDKQYPTEKQRKRIHIFKVYYYFHNDSTPFLRQIEKGHLALFDHLTFFGETIL